MFVAQKSGNEASVECYEPPRDVVSRITRTVRRMKISKEISRYATTAPVGTAFFTHDQTMYGRDPWRHLPENDLLQLHFVSKFVDYQAFFSTIPRGKQLVWTMHGMEALTGGCHYDYGCGKFAQDCGGCPQFGSTSQVDLTRKVWRRKRDSYKNLAQGQLHIVSPSRWLQNEVRRSSLLSRFECSVIPYGLDTDVFAPRDRRFAREILGIPLDARVVLFLADGVDDPRKGFHFLKQAIEGVGADAKIFLLSVGTGLPPDFPEVRNVHVPAISNDGMLSCIYSAADVFAMPSQQDNLPNTILEALACGVPVAGFDVGGVPDAVRPGVSGRLARPGDVGELRKAIVEMLQDEGKLAEMSANCRKIAVQEYALEVQARRYKQLYEHLLKNTAKGTLGV